MLVDQDKTPRLMISLRGHRVALTFMYTRCPMPDFCPRMDRNFVEVQTIIAQTPEEMLAAANFAGSGAIMDAVVSIEPVG